MARSCNWVPALLRNSYTDTIMSEQSPTNVLLVCGCEGAPMATRAALFQVAHAGLKPAMQEVTSTT